MEPSINNKAGYWRYDATRVLQWQWAKGLPSGLKGHLFETYGSGREALFALAKRWAATGNNTIFLPAFLPEGVEQPFREAGWTVVYYDLQAHKTTPDWEQLEALAHRHPPQAALLIHYFGIPQDAQQFKSLLPNATIIEDWAHSYPTPKLMDTISPENWWLFSPNKLGGLLDGAWLGGSKPAPVMKRKTSSLQNAYLFWRCIYLIGVSIYYRLPFRWRFLRRVAEAAYVRSYYRLLELTRQPHPVSRLGQWVLHHFPHEPMIEKRMAQAQLYHQLLNLGPGARLIQQLPDHPLIGYPLWIEDRTAFQQHLGEHGIKGTAFTDRWWFLDEEQTAHFPEAKALFDHHCLLPINDRLSRMDIERIIEVVNTYTAV